jgi:hypothetical protein
MVFGRVRLNSSSNRLVQYQLEKGRTQAAHQRFLSSHAHILIVEASFLLDFEELLIVTICDFVL